MKIGIVVSETYWDEITNKMLTIAEETLYPHETEVIKVPGSYDIPLAAQKLAKRNDIHGVITLGAVIQGQTAHDEVICHAIATGLTQISLQYHKPVVLGVNGPKMTAEQAVRRIPRAKEVAEACLKML